MARRKTKWSYNAGERGRNWVRAYCKGCDRHCTRSLLHTGGLYLEWRENDKRRSALIEGVADVDEAKRRADALAARFATMVPVPAVGPITLAQLIERYHAGRTPQKGESKQ